MSVGGAARAMRAGLALCVVAALASPVAGCGDDRQDVGTPAENWTVAVEKWEFPERQSLGTPVTMKLVVRNVDSRDMPNIAVTIRGLTAGVRQQGAQSRARAIWIVNDVRKGDQTAYNSVDSRTYSLGPLAAGDTKIFKLPVTPLKRGKHVVSYEIAPDVYGKGSAETADGTPATGKREIAIDPTPNFDESVFD